MNHNCVFCNMQLSECTFCASEPHQELDPALERQHANDQHELGCQEFHMTLAGGEQLTSMNS